MYLRFLIWKILNKKNLNTIKISEFIFWFLNLYEFPIVFQIFINLFRQKKKPNMMNNQKWTSCSELFNSRLIVLNCISPQGGRNFNLRLPFKSQCLSCISGRTKSTTPFLPLSDDAPLNCSSLLAHSRK